MELLQSGFEIAAQIANQSISETMEHFFNTTINWWEAFSCFWGEQEQLGGQRVLRLCILFNDAPTQSGLARIF